MNELNHTEQADNDVINNETSNTPTTNSRVELAEVALGDVIQLHAPQNLAVDKQVYYVFYIDDQKIKLLNASNHQLLKLNIADTIADQTIIGVDLISRSELSGFARQHKLEPPQWIDIHFGGDMPAVISGEITNLEEDMIEITTYPGMRVIYVDFAYQGIPDNLPIDKIVLRERPKALQTSLRSLLEGTTEISRDEIEAEATMVIDEEDGLPIIRVPENVSMNPSPAEIIDEFIDNEVEVPRDDDADEEEELASMVRLFDVPESERRYSEEMQVADLLGELVSKLAPDQRTASALKDIHRFVTRFKELRREFSVFDENGEVVMPKVTDHLHKPLIDRILNLDSDIKWILPVVYERNELMDWQALRSADSHDNSITNILTPMTEFVHSIEAAEKAFAEKSQTDPTQSIKYDRMMKEIDALCAPATQILQSELPDNADVYIANKEVKTTIETLVNNDGEFNMISSVTKSGEMHESGKHKYTIRRYTPASTRMVLDETVRRRAYDRKPIGSADRANVRSIIMLPRAALLQSQYKSPSAGLYLKSKLAEIPVYKFLLFRPSTKLTTKEISNLDEEVAYEDAIISLKQVINEQAEDGNPKTPADKVASGEPFLKTITHYTIASDVNAEPNEESLRRMLNTVIPRTRTLVRWMRDSIEHLYSFSDIISTLEPFCIESANITFGQYKEIRYYVKQKIAQYRARVVGRQNEFKVLRKLQELAVPVLNRIEVILDESREFKDYMLSTYHLDSTPSADTKQELTASKKTAKVILANSSETLQHLLAVDGAAAYSAILNTFLMQTLTIPESVVGILKAPTISSEDTKAILTSKCDRRFIAKKYKSIAELRKDDNTPDVFYDKEYDDTPYNLLDKYKDEKKRFKTDEEFREFFTETLIQKHDCPPNLAPALSASILAKKKRVRSGEYAMLEIKPTLANKLEEERLQEDEKRDVEKEADLRKHVEFYKRVRDTWELDKTVDMTAFIDTNTLFCELSETCNKISEVNQCVPSEMAALQMRLSKRARIMEEFENRVAKSFDEVAAELQTKLSQMRKQIRRNKLLLQTKLYRQNNYSYELGKFAISTDAIVESPHTNLLDRIMSIPDFIAKQNAIYTFCTNLCRDPKPTSQEDEHWMYCKDTNTKLFPMSIFRLARAFIIDQTEYMKLLDQIIRENGELSDDGDAIVDKYTGYVLRKIDYSAEEGFDESGFRIVTNAVVNNKDREEMILNVLSKKDRVFESPIDQAAYNVFRTLSENMGISKDTAETSIEEFVMRITSKIMNDPDTILPEDAYNQLMAEQAQKQTKKIPKMPYTTYFNQSLITLTSCATFAAMQTLIPSFKPKKTFPGCVKSFAGYPLDNGNATNDSGLRYVACVLDKSKRGSSQPWSSIEPLNLDKLLARLKTAMKTIYGIPDVAKMYELKREYLLSNPDKDIPDEVSVSRWVHFQPPVIVFKMDERAITGISEEFEKEVFKSILQGSAEQFKHIGIVKGKLWKHGYAVFELIEQVVKKKNMLLSSSAGLAFLENACCNEDGTKPNPLNYFQQERPELTQMLQKINKMEEVLGRVKLLTKAKTFFDPKSSRLVGAAIPDTIISRMIYETFIHYGNFDNDAPIPADLLPLIAKKPEYNRFASIDEKIAFMKRHGKHYGIDDFHAIMRIVNGRNMIHLKPTKNINCLGGLKDMLDYFEEKDSHLIESRLRDLLRKTIEEYDPKTAFHEERATNRKLNRYLQRANENMREVVLTFLDAHANLNNSQLNRMEQFLAQITSWDISDMASVTREIGNMVYNLAKVYPNKVLADRFQSSAPKHWSYARPHLLKLEDATKAFYANIAAFSDKNPNSTFSRYLSMTVAQLTDLSLFLQQIPLIAPLVREGVTYWSFYTYETVLLLHEYCLLSVLHEYVVLANDREFVQMRAEEIKETRRAKIANQETDAAFIFDNLEDDMPEDYGAANQVRQVHIVESDSTELKKTAAKLLSAMIDREHETKRAIDRSYKRVMNETMLLKFKDKKHITDYMKNLERDERRIEQALRSHKIGRWNVGMQKGLYQYDQRVYEQELELWGNDDTAAIDDSIQTATNTIKDTLDRLDRARMGGNEAEDLDRIDEQEHSAEYDGGDGWDNLNEDYTDGVYYEEDAERGDYDEY